MKTLFAAIVVAVLCGIPCLAAGPPAAGMKYNAYTTNDTAVIDARVGAVVGNNVKYWGAQGTNGDDTVAILNTVAAVRAAGGGAVKFPPGSYILTQPLDFSGTSAVSVALEGANSGNQYSNATVLIFRIASTTNAACIDLRGAFAGFELSKLSLSNSLNALPIVFIGNKKTTIHDCYFSFGGSYGDAIVAGGTNLTNDGSVNTCFGGYKTSIKDCVFSFCGHALLGGAFANGITFADNQYANGSGPIVEFNISAQSDSQNQIIGNVFECAGNTTYGVKLTRGYGNYISGNGFYDAYDNENFVAAIYYGDGCSYNLNEGNFFDIATLKPMVIDTTDVNSSLDSSYPAVIQSSLVVGRGGAYFEAPIGPQLTSRSQFGSGIILQNTSPSEPGIRNWVFRTDNIEYGDLAIIQGNANLGDPLTNGTRRLRISASGNFDFGGGQLLNCAAPSFVTNNNTDPVTLGNQLTVGDGSLAAVISRPQLTSRSFHSAGLQLQNTYTNIATARNWTITSDFITYGDLAIVQGNSASVDPFTNGVPWIYIAPNGEVGVNTNDPSFTLDVGGPVNATAFYQNGHLFTGGGGGATNLTPWSSPINANGFGLYGASGITGAVITATSRFVGNGSGLTNVTAQYAETAIQANLTSDPAISLLGIDGFDNFTVTSIGPGLLGAQPTNSNLTGWAAFPTNVLSGLGGGLTSNLTMWNGLTTNDPVGIMAQYAVRANLTSNPALTLLGIDGSDNFTVTSIGPGLIGAQPTNANLTLLSANNAASLTNLNGAAIQSGTVNSNVLDALTKAQLALAGSGGGGGGDIVSSNYNVFTAPSNKFVGDLYVSGRAFIGTNGAGTNAWGGALNIVSNLDAEGLFTVGGTNFGTLLASAGATAANAATSGYPWNALSLPLHSTADLAIGLYGFTAATNAGPISSSQVTTGLGYTPLTNTQVAILAALTFTPATNGAPVAGSQVTGASTLTNGLASQAYADTKTNATGIIQIVTNSNPLAVGITGNAATATAASGVAAIGVTTNTGYGVFGTGAFSAAGGGGGVAYSVADTSAANVFLTLPTPASSAYTIVKTNAAFTFYVNYLTTTNIISGNGVWVECVPISGAWFVRW